MMTFYVGQDYRKYEEMFKVIRIHAAKTHNGGSNAAVFRWMVRKFYEEIERLNGKEVIPKEVEAELDLEPAEE